jgi:hypothetical protein
MSRWPPAVWLMVALGSLLVLVGYDGADVYVPALIAGLVLIVGAVGLSFFMAFGRWGHRPRATGVAWLIPATAVFYLLCACAAVISGGEYAVAAIAAGLIPLTATTLLTATARAKTVGDDDARRETTAAASADPFPGIGMDDDTPLGDTPEHSEAERVAEPDRRFARRRSSRAKR